MREKRLVGDIHRAGKQTIFAIIRFIIINKPLFMEFALPRLLPGAGGKRFVTSFARFIKK